MIGKLYVAAALNLAATFTKGIAVTVGLWFVSKPVAVAYVAAYALGVGTTWYAERVLIKAERKELEEQVDRYGKALGVGNA